MTDFAITLVPLGMRGGAALLSIGAYALTTSSPTDERRFAQNVQAQDTTPGLHRDPAILSTWKRDLAHTAAGSVLQKDAQPLRAAIERFHAWVALYPEPRRFWSTHPHLDWPLYAEACRALSVAQQFSFTDVRDVTTLLEWKEAPSRGVRDVVVARLAFGSPASKCEQLAQLIGESRTKLDGHSNENSRMPIFGMSTATKLQTLLGLIMILSSGAVSPSSPMGQAVIAMIGAVCIILVVMK